MTKKAAVEFFGSVNLTAEALRVTAQAVDKWPRVLTDGLALRVLGAALQNHSVSKIRAAFPEAFGG